jgi:hypothetical protein
MGVLGATGFGVAAADLAAERCDWVGGAAVEAGTAGIAVGSLVFVPQLHSRKARTAKKATRE